MIPEEKRQAVARGLRAAFGTEMFEHISDMPKGNAMSQKFRVVVGGKPYLLRIEMRVHDPSRHYACMRSAAEAGVAPHVLYTNVDDRVAITDFVRTKPLAREEALTRLPAVLRTLHGTQPFEKAPFNTTCTFLLEDGPARDGFLKQFRESGVMLAAEADELFALYAQTAALCVPDEADLVASHNDLFKPDNILFDGDRVWLVDWEAAFLNDRYADLAVVANQIVTDEAEERLFLESYFGAPATQAHRMRLRRMQQLSHVFYAMAFLHLGAAGKPVDWSTPAPSFESFRARFWNGDVDLSHAEDKIMYGRVHWARLREAAGSRMVEMGVG